MIKRTLLLSSTLLLLSGCGQSFTEQQSEPLTFTDPLPTPTPKANGRGEPLEKLVPGYASDYEADALLKEDVINFRRWNWKELYTSLEAKAKAQPQNLNIYRLQVEAYLINQNYTEALSQTDQILRRAPKDTHALANSVLTARILGLTDMEQQRLKALRSVSPSAADDMQAVLNLVETNFKKTYGPQPQTSMVPNAIAVFGQSPNKDGTPSTGLLSRLEKAKEMALKFPQSVLVVSGGDVSTPYAEADVMKKWLMEQGIPASRIETDSLARDTYGNALGMLPLFKKHGASKVLVVGTERHLPRASTTLQAYAKRVGFPLQIDTAGGGGAPKPEDMAWEKQYTFVNAARAAGLFSLSDFARYR